MYKRRIASLNYKKSTCDSLTALVDHPFSVWLNLKMLHLITRPSKAENNKRDLLKSARLLKRSHKDMK